MTQDKNESTKTAANNGHEDGKTVENVTKGKGSPVLGEKYEEIHFVDSTRPVWNYSLFTDEDISNFQNGTHYSLYNIFGSHAIEVLNTAGYYFAVWAPNATYISVTGNFFQCC